MVYQRAEWKAREQRSVNKNTGEMFYCTNRGVSRQQTGVRASHGGRVER